MALIGAPGAVCRPKACWALFVIPALLLSSAGGCGDKRQQDENVLRADSADVYTLEVIKDRKVKDLHFLRDESSPLTPEDRQSFVELFYFPPNRTFAFYTVLERLPDPRAVVIATSKDRPREMLFIGHLPFSYDNKSYRLQVFMPKDTAEEKYWFIPFTDATTGSETYSGGRYIDVDDPASDSVFLDFNYAYNPYCAYNARYDCPIPPAENRLTLAIRAGEKAYRKY